MAEHIVMPRTYYRVYAALLVLTAASLWLAAPVCGQTARDGKGGKAAAPGDKGPREAEVRFANGSSVLMDDADWKDVRDAVEFLKDNPRHKSLEGECWKVYRLGEVIRVDLKIN